MACKSAEQNIVLVGFMGTGKSTVGQVLAERMGRSWIDLDHAIVARAGMSIPDFFEKEGEEAFRTLESQIVKEVAANPGQVVSCGGGIVKNQENMDELSQSGVLVCLTARAETVLERVGSDTNRPLLAGPDRLARIRELLAERAPLYRQISLQVATDDLDPEQIAEAVQVCIKA